MARGKIHNISLAAPPEVLTVDPGDTVRVTTEFDYVGPAISCRMISAIWHPTFLDPHDEIVRGNKSFSIPSSPPPGNHITVTMDLLVPSGEVGTDYGLYSSIRDIPGPDIYTDYYPNIITIAEEVVPEFKGTISKKELEYNESQGAIPVSNVPQGKRGLVHIWGRNDMVTSQKLGIHWIVKDPGGIVVEDYQDWEFGTTGSGDDHHFIGGRFDIDKPGNWTIGISLAMNPTSPVTVDSYAGVLCTVGALPAEYTLEVTVEPPATGYVTKSPSKATYSAGEVVTLTAHPYSGYEFDHWGGWPPYPGVGSTSPSIQITMDADWWVVAAFREVAPVTTVTVALRNPPSDAENWSLSLCDWDITVPIRFVGWNGKERLDIAEAATFEIPSGLKFPLRILALQLTKWKVPGEVLQQVYYVQSFRPYLWDWDKSDWSDEPDPTYKEVFIPEHGSYFYNVSTERFERV